MTPEQVAKSVLGLFGLGAGTKHVCPGGRACSCGSGSLLEVDLREREGVR
jgi:hypothetical protein